MSSERSLFLESELPPPPEPVARLGGEGTKNVFLQSELGLARRLLGLGITTGEKSERAFFAERTPPPPLLRGAGFLALLGQRSFN